METLAVQSIKTRSMLIRNICQSDEFYAILLEHGFECGPFDGGCLMVATALRNCWGGDLWGVYGRSLLVAKAPIMCQHAVVKIKNLYYDGDGISSEQKLRHQWLQQEHLQIDHLAPLPDVKFPNDPEVIQALTTLFSNYLKARA